MVIFLSPYLLDLYITKYLQMPEYLGFALETQTKTKTKSKTGQAKQEWEWVNAWVSDV